MCAPGAGAARPKPNAASTAPDPNPMMTAFPARRAQPAQSRDLPRPGLGLTREAPDKPSAFRGHGGLKKTYPRWPGWAYCAGMDTSFCQAGTDPAAASTFEEMLLVRYERLALKALDYGEQAVDRARRAVASRTPDRAAEAEAQAGGMLTKAVWAHQTLIALRARLLAGEIDVPRALRKPGGTRRAATTPQPPAAAPASPEETAPPQTLRPPQSDWPDWPDDVAPDDDAADEDAALLAVLMARAEPALCEEGQAGDAPPDLPDPDQVDALIDEALASGQLAPVLEALLPGGKETRVARAPP